MESIQTGTAVLKMWVFKLCVVQMEKHCYGFAVPDNAVQANSIILTL